MMELQSGTSAKRQKGSEYKIPLDVKSTLIFHKSKQNYETAKRECRRIGGRLASLNSKEKIKILEDDRTERGGKNIWIGAHKDKRTEEFIWASGEYVEPANLHIYGNNDYGNDCMGFYEYASTSTSSGYLFNNYDCSELFPFICEIDQWRPNEMVTGLEEKKVWSQFTVILLPNYNYTEAVAYCEEDVSGNTGGRLFGPTSKREMRILNEALTRKGRHGRYWLGATRANMGDEPDYTNDDKIPTEIAKGWETDHGGYCMIYDSNTQMFGWEFCNIDDRMHDLTGFICQDDIEDNNTGR